MTDYFCSRLPFFGLIQVSGTDRAEFLHNQLSNDILHLPANAACLATYNTAKGRVLANMLVLNRGDDILLVAAADLCDKLIKRLRMYVLRSQVTLQIQPEWAVAGCSMTHETAPAMSANPQCVLPTTGHQNTWQITLPGGNTLILGTSTHLPAYHKQHALWWHCQEIRSGQPWISAATSETCVAQMLNQHLLGAVHFKKGCYPGQEIIARAQYRGQVKRGLVLLSTPSMLNEGETVLDEHQEDVGLIINQVPQTNGTLALAVIKHAAANMPLHTADNPVLVRKFCFFNRPEDAA